LPHLRHAGALAHAASERTADLHGSANTLALPHAAALSRSALALPALRHLVDVVLRAAALGEPVAKAGGKFVAPPHGHVAVQVTPTKAAHHRRREATTAAEAAAHAPHHPAHHLPPMPPSRPMPICAPCIPICAESCRFCISSCMFI